MSQLLIDDLKELIAKKQIIIVVGSGVSLGATNRNPLASWIGLIEHGIDRCTQVVSNLPTGWANRQKEAVHSGDMDDLLSAAEQVSSKLKAPNGGEFRRWLSETVGRLKAQDKSVIEALHQSGAVIATTNYDDLLETPDLPAVTWRDGSRVEQVLKGDEKGILHLHGHWRDPEFIVLGIRSYEDVKRDDHAQTMLKAMRTVSNLLFVGCGDGLVDPNIGNLLKWSGQVFASSVYRQFVLAVEAEQAKIQAQHPSQERIFVLSYGANHTDLAPFLRILSPSSSPPPRVPGPPSEELKQTDPYSQATTPASIVTNRSINKIKILFLSANPAGNLPLALDEEIREITNKIRAAEYRNSIELISRWAIRPDDLLQALNEHKPHIVHFSGHGSPTDEIILLDNNRNPKPVSQVALASLFRTLKDNVQVVFLNACYSRPQAEAITQTIDCAIGINKAIGDQAAITFAASFYRAIGFGRSVQEAFDQATVALLLEGSPEDKLPELIIQKGISASQISPARKAMPLTAEEFSQFHQALLSAFPNLTSLAQMVRFGLNENLVEIAGTGNLADVLFSLIEWAQSQGRENELIISASRANTGNPALRAFAKRFSHLVTSSTMQEAVSVAPDINTAHSTLPSTDTINVTNRPTPIQLFYSYSHKDEKLRDKLETHLALLKRQSVIASWHDRKIGAGQEWANQINEYLNSAQIILLLVSSDFLASDYCYDIELKRAMERHKAGEARVIPIILRPCDWQSAPIGGLQALPRDAKPITDWTN